MTRLRIIAAVAGSALIAAVAYGALANDPPADPFDAMDTNHDGTISKAEFDAFKPERGGFRGDDGPPRANPGWGPGFGGGHHHGDRDRMGPPDIKTLDTNGDGKVSLDEFSVPMKQHFDRLDANHDGSLSASELQAPDMPPPPPAG